MRKFGYLIVISLCVLLISAPTMAAEEHWIQDKSDDGSVIILEDGSIWRVDPVDRIDSSLWLPTDNIVVPDSEDSLINTDDGEKVDATRIK